jgi:hypothetical protein
LGHDALAIPRDADVRLNVAKTGTATDVVKADDHKNVPAVDAVHTEMCDTVSVAAPLLVHVGVPDIVIVSLPLTAAAAPNVADARVVRPV